MGVPLSWREYLEAAGNAGDLVGGLATVAAVCLAIREVGRWKKQRAEEKRAEVAGQCLVASMRACRALESWALLIASSPDLPDVAAGSPPYSAAMDSHEVGRERSRPALGELRAVTPLAIVYLEPEQHRLVTEVSRLEVQILGRLDALRGPVANSGELVARIRAFGEVARRARELEDRCAESLGPAARFEV